MDWHDLAMTSQYQTAVAIKRELLMGNVQGALTGLEELFGKAKRSAEKDMNSETPLSELSWQAVFEDDYHL